MKPRSPDSAWACLGVGDSGGSRLGDDRTGAGGAPRRHATNWQGLVLGEQHHASRPTPKIGWTGNWGMAASAKDKDYVHLLLDRIAKAAGGKPQVKIKNVADFERRLNDYNLRDELKEELAFEADVVIVVLGENAGAGKTPEAKAQFRKAFANLFAELKQHGRHGSSAAANSGKTPKRTS